MLLAEEQIKETSAECSTKDLEVTYWKLLQSLRKGKFRVNEIQIDKTSSTENLLGPGLVFLSSLGTYQDPNPAFSTQPSSQNSGGFSSLLESSYSSLSGPDSINYTNPSQPPSNAFDPFGTQLITDLLGCPLPSTGAPAMPTFAPAPTKASTNAEVPWLPMDDAHLDESCSSRMPQILAELTQEALRRANSVVEQSEFSPSDFEPEIEDEHSR